jgi:putative spermidine/putrescine transport system permease protein
MAHEPIQKTAGMHEGKLNQPGPDPRAEAMTTAAPVPPAVEANEDVLKVRWTLFSLPGAAVVTAIFLFPISILLVYSFMRDGRNGRLIKIPTLENYVTVLTDFFYVRVILETLALGLVVASLSLVMAFPVAYFLARTKTRWRGLLIFLAISPLMISGVIRNVGWLPILGETGAINTILLSLGIISHPLHLLYNFVGVVIGLTNVLMPYMILLLMIVIQRVNYEVEEAAINLGASPWRRLTLVLVPLTKRGAAASFMLVFTLAISSYTTPAVMGGGKILVMPTFIQQQIAVVLKNARGSAMTMILLVIAVILTIASTRIFDRKEKAR